MLFGPFDVRYKKCKKEKKGGEGKEGGGRKSRVAGGGACGGTERQEKHFEAKRKFRVGVIDVFGGCVPGPVVIAGEGGGEGEEAVEINSAASSIKIWLECLPDVFSGIYENGQRYPRNDKSNANVESIPFASFNKKISVE